MTIIHSGYGVETVLEAKNTEVTYSAIEATKAAKSRNNVNLKYQMIPK